MSVDEYIQQCIKPYPARRKAFAIAKIRLQPFYRPHTVIYVIKEWL